MKKIVLLFCSSFFFCILQLTGQTLVFSITGDCLPSGVPEPLRTVSLSLNGTLNDRNRYSEPGLGYEVIHTSTNGGQWEIKNLNQGFSTLLWKTSNTSPNPPAGTSGWIVGAGYFSCAVTEFYGSGTLPIQLLNFNVHPEKGQNQLTWETAAELNNQHFEIERSTDGKTFTELAQVKAANRPYRYQFLDVFPFYLTYYRLKQIDFDGKATYSTVVSVMKERMGLQLCPTLVSNGQLNLSMEGEQDFTVVNSLGQPVLRGKTEQRIDVSGLSKGIYFLKIEAETAMFLKL